MINAINPINGKQIETAFNRVLSYGLTATELETLEKSIPDNFFIESCDANFTDLIAVSCSCIAMNPDALDVGQISLLNECFEDNERVLFLLTKKTVHEFSFETHNITLCQSNSLGIENLSRFLNNIATPCFSNCHSFMLNDGFVVIDIETTGISPLTDEIISISAIRVADYKMLDTFHSLIKPNSELSPFIEEITGITNGMLSDAPTLSSVFGKFSTWYHLDPLVIFNKEYDLPFLTEAYRETGYTLGKRGSIDILSLSKKLFANKLFERPSKLQDTASVVLGDYFIENDYLDTSAELFISLLHKLRQDYDIHSVDKIARLYDETTEKV